MSRFFNRLGTQAIKFSFEINVQRVKLALDQSYNIIVTFKRGNHSNSTMRKAMLNIQKGEALFDEVLLLDATIYFEPKTNKFQSKKATVVVLLDTGKGKKQAGEYEFDLADYAQKNIKVKDEQVKLSKCPDPNALVSYRIVCTKVGDVNDSQMFIFRQIKSSDDDRPEEFQFASNNRSMSQDKSFQSSMTTRPQEIQMELEKTEEKSRRSVNKSADNKKQQQQQKQEQLNNNPFQAEDEQDTLVRSQLVKSQVLEEIQPRYQPQNSNQKISPRLDEIKTISKQTTQPQPQTSYIKQNSQPQPSFSALKEPFYKQPNIDLSSSVKQNIVIKNITLPEKQDIVNSDDDIIIIDNDEDQSEQSPQKLYQPPPLKIEQIPQPQVLSENLQITQKLNSKIQDLDKQNQDLRQQLLKNQSNNNQTLIQAAELEKEKKRTKEYEQKANLLEQELNSLKTSHRKFDQQQKNLQSDYESLRRDHLNNQEQLNSIQGEKANIQGQNKSIDSELKKNREKITSQREEIERLRLEVENISGENDKISQLLVVTKEANKQLQREKENINQNKQDQHSFNPNQQIDQNSETKIQELKQQLKVAVEKKEEALSAQTLLAIQIQNFKIEIDRLKSQNQNNAQDKQSEVNEELNKYEQEQAQKRLNEAQCQIQDLQDELTSQNQDFERRLEMAQQRIEDLQQSSQTQGQDFLAEAKVESLKKKYDGQLKILQKHVEYKDKKLNEQGEELQKVHEELEELRNLNEELKLKQREDDDDEDEQKPNQAEQEQYKKKQQQSNVNRYKKLKEKVVKMEEEYQDRIDTLQKYVLKLEDPKSNHSTNDDMKLAKLSVENEKLKSKLKDYEKKGTSEKSLTEIIIENKRLNDEIIQMKLHQTNIDKKYQQASKDLRDTQETSKKFKDLSDMNEEELIQSKIQIGDIMNIIMEKADNKLVDTLTSYMQSKRRKAV